MVKRRAKLLFHINMQPPALLLSLHSAHMFLFKASRADCDDWCAHYPPAQCSVQRLTPKGSRGEAFPPNRTVDFPQGNFTVLPVICSSILPLQPPVDRFISSSTFRLSASALLHSRLCHGTTLGAFCCPCRQFYCPRSSCFDTYRCFSVPRCGLGVGSAVWPHVQEDAAKLGAFALIGQGGRKQGLAHGDVPGAWWRWHNWLWESFARCHGRQMADSLFLYLRERQLGAHGLGAVRGRGKLREAREFGNQSQGWRDRGCN